MDREHMSLKILKSKLACALLVAAVAFCFSQVWSSRACANPPSAVGTWTGESVCTDKNRPACKNEVVVYRIEEISGKQGMLLLLADKIIEGKRDPMGKLECKYDEAAGTLSCEFTRRQTHGLWQYKVSGDRMEGTLVLLPDKTVGRRVTVRRVKDDEVPPAPARELYEGD
jgi:hypothetical protein